MVAPISPAFICFSRTCSQGSLHRMHLPNVTEGHPIRAKCFPDSALWFQDYSLFDEEAKVLLQKSWNSRRRIQRKLWNQHQQISSPWWLGWFWGLGTGLCCWTPSKNFPKTSMEAAHTHYGPGWL